MSDELCTLTDEIELCGFTLRPWSLSMLADLTPHIDRVITAFRARGVTLEKFLAAVQAKSFDIDTDILFCILPEIPAILSRTLKIGIEEVDMLDQEKVGILISAIGVQNLAWLKNLSRPLNYVMASMAEGLRTTNAPAT